MWRTTLAGLRSRTRRLLAASVAILIGVAFVATTLLVSASLAQGVRQAVAAGIGDEAVVLTPDARELSAATVARVRQVPGIGALHLVRQAALELGPGEGSLALAVTAPEPSPQLRVQHGRMPRSTGEVALSTTAVGTTGARVGDPVSVHRPSGGDATAHVVGVVDTSSDPAFGAAPVAFATNSTLTGWAPGADYTEIRAGGTPGHTDSQLRQATSQAVGPGLTVRTGPQEVDARVQQAAGGTDALTMVLLGFAAVALLVAAIVIANTFTILLAQRTRELALLRCVGATRAQAFCSVALEALLVGLVASLAGVAVGIGLTAGFVSVAGNLSLGVPVTGAALTPFALAVPLLCGVVVTVLSALLPARRATRVAPLAALRPVLVSARSRRGRRGITLAALLFLGGTAVLLLGAAQGSVLVGIVGGIGSFLGVLLSGSFLVPALVRGVGGIPARLAHVPGRLAVDNAVRNPSRAAATCAALLVGVTLITLMSVGAATSTQAADRRIAEQLPIDVSVTSAQGTVPPSVRSGLGAVDGLSAGAEVRAVTASVAGQPGTTLLGVDRAAARRVLRAGAVVAQLRPGTLVADADTAQGLGLREGQRVPVRVHGRSVSLRAHVVVAGPGLVVAQPQLRRLAPQAPVRQVWLRTADDADLSTVLTDVGRVVAGHPNLAIGGAAPQRAQLHQVVDVVLLVVTGLLAVAVLIALIGIGNTLSLSVLERTQESALLRALGLTRGQLRGMLSLEAGLLALVGAGLGVLLGTFYGWAAAHALLGAHAEVGLVVPWARLLGVVGVALAAGLLAAVLPARRAARVAPAAALAAE